MMRAQQHVEPAGIRGVCEEDVAAFILQENAETWKLFAYVSTVGRDRSEVVVDLPLVDLLLRERDVEVEVEIAAEGRDPFEVPAHARLVRENLGERCARDGYDRHVVVGEVLSRSVDVLGLEGAAGTGGIPFGRVHQMMDNQLAAAVEEVWERLAALFGFERIALLDLQAGEPASLGGEPVPLAHVRLFLLEQRLPCGEPFLLRYDLVRFHGAFLRSTNTTTVDARATHFVPADFCPRRISRRRISVV